MEIKHTSKLLDYADFVSFSPLYVETGSCTGESIQRALDAGFQRVISVEAMPEYFEMAKKRFAINPAVQVYKGISYEALPVMIANLTYRAVFFLDAHPAGPGTAGHEEIMQGQSDFGQDYIITRELEVILAHRNDHLIIIDDLAEGSKEDESYMKLCLFHNKNYTFEYYDEQLPGVERRINKVLVCRP